MQTKTIYEEQLLKDIQGLPLPFQEKLVKIVHILKTEVIMPSKAHPHRKEKISEKLTVYKCGGRLKDFSREDAYEEAI